MKTILSTLFIFVIGVSFAQEEQVQVIEVPAPIVTEKNQPKPEVITFPDVEANFPGGASAMMSFISQNIQYPVEALKDESQGKVYVAFVVDEKGEISKVVIKRGVCPSLDNEAKRVVYLMPNWTPGESRGKQVKTRVRIPILFTLN